MEKRSMSRLPVYFAALLLVLILLLFLVELASYSPSSDSSSPPVNPGTVAALIQDADAAHGNQLIEDYGCIACHRLGAENGIAPSFVGIAERAEQRHPPLDAPAYIYESITSPQAFVVEGYVPVMPQDYRNRLSDQELGDIIAYLLTVDAH
jgi:mono/diheme cytochrome c family protein